MPSATSTLTAFDFHHVKMLVTPRLPDAPAIDTATLHILLQQAALEAYGTVGASLGDAMTILSVAKLPPANSDDKAAREVIVRISNAALTSFLATLPLSSASEQFSFEILGQSPSLPLLKAATSAGKAGSLEWLGQFEVAV